MLIIVATLLGLSLPAAAASMPEVDRFVEERMKRHLVPGLAVVVIRNGEVVHRNGFGDLDETRPVITGALKLRRQRWSTSASRAAADAGLPSSD